jgi:hypothetical protein
VTRPEDALEAARAAAARAREAGAYADDLSGFAIAPTDRVSAEQLLAWAVIEPDPEAVRSTRRLGAPITWVKRLLLRGLRQQFAELTAQQTRFNLQLVAALHELDDRVSELEQRTAPPR